MPGTLRSSPTPPAPLGRRTKHPRHLRDGRGAVGNELQTLLAGHDILRAGRYGERRSWRLDVVDRGGLGLLRNGPRDRQHRRTDVARGDLA